MTDEKRGPGRPPKNPEETRAAAQQVAQAVHNLDVKTDIAASVTKPKALGPDNANTNYIPSVERNEADQALQPTGAGGTAGKGQWEFDENDLPETTATWKPEPIVPALTKLVDKAHDSPEPIQASEDPNEAMFPVTMLRNYRPASDRWYPIRADGRPGKKPDYEAGESPKVAKGYRIVLPLSEAKQVIARGLAVRADALPG